MPGRRKKADAVAEQGLAVNKNEFSIVTREDYPRVDNLCREALLRFYEHLLEKGMDPEEATSLASGADLYVRDFLVDCKGANIFHERQGLVRQFAGNWYIVNTIEPDIAMLGRHLRGIGEFYRYLRDQGLISEKCLAAVEVECSMLAYYEGRIDSFWEIEGDGFIAWERECTIKDPPVSSGRA